MAEPTSESSDPFSLTREERDLGFEDMPVWVEVDDMPQMKVFACFFIEPSDFVCKTPLADGSTGFQAVRYGMKTGDEKPDWHVFGEAAWKDASTAIYQTQLHVESTPIPVEPYAPPFVEPFKPRQVT